MTLTAGTIVWLFIGSLILAALAVVLDRVNFPQKPFRARRIQTGAQGAARDRTGAHVVNDGIDDESAGEVS